MAETTKRFQLHTYREGEAVGMERLGKLEHSEVFLSLEEDITSSLKCLYHLLADFSVLEPNKYAHSTMELS